MKTESEALPASFNPSTGEAIIWPTGGLPDDEVGRRKPDGTWIFGVEAMPTADELKDIFEPVRDRNLFSSLAQEAIAGYRSLNSNQAKP